MAYEMGEVAINAGVKVAIDGEVKETSAGRVLFNEALPDEMEFVNSELTKKELKKVTARILDILGHDGAAERIDHIKNLAFAAVSVSGISWGMDDLHVPEKKAELMDAAEKKVEEINEQYEMGLLTAEEKRVRSIEIWNETKNAITDTVRDSLDPEGPVYSMVYSKARGSESVVVQMMGMKGLVAGPTGDTIDLPVKSSFKEGFNVLEYFISTHGARKGTADTALRTATAGYLTRRLVDVSQDIIVREEDCGDTEGAYLYRADSEAIGQDFAERVEGRVPTEDIKKPGSRKILARAGELITKEQARTIADEKDIDRVTLRTVITCKTRYGVCRKCYGIDLGRAELVNIGQAVGTVAAQAIGEPGTQLTMRTFHIGGVAGSDITQGLPRVEEIFEARTPKGEAAIAEEGGTVKEIFEEGLKTTKIRLETGAGKNAEMKEYVVPKGVDILVGKGDVVGKGTQLTEGHIDLKKLYSTMGLHDLHRYIVHEIQEIYASQGEGVNDKHIEVMVRQMLSRVLIKDAGDTEFVTDDVVERDRFLEANEQAKAEGKRPAEGERLLMGITKVALSTESFLSAASFQETARVLINASLTGKVDRLRGLKENVIIGRLIPAGTGFRERSE